MSIKTTKEIERDDAIDKLVQIKMRALSLQYKLYLKQLSNRDLEDLLEEFNDDTFTNYSVYSKL